MDNLFDFYVWTLLTVAFLYLFVCVDSNGKGYLGKAKRFFWVTCPGFLLSIVEKVCG